MPDANGRPVDGDIEHGPNGRQAVRRAGRWVELDPLTGLEDLGNGYYRNPQGQVLATGQRGGRPSRVSGPNDTAVRQATEAATGYTQALQALDRVDEQLANIDAVGPAGWLRNPTNLSVLQQSVRDLQLRLKENPYNLGVLNGPDLMIIDQIVGDPGALQNMVLAGTLRPRLRNLAGIIGQGYRNNAGTYRAQGGYDTALPPLYQSPRSQYTREQWGRQGVVNGPPARAQRAPQQPSDALPQVVQGINALVTATATGRQQQRRSGGQAQGRGYRILSVE